MNRAICFVIAAQVFLLSHTGFSQWVEQTPNLPGTGRVYVLSVVDEDTAWALGIEFGFSSPYQGFTITHNGGNTWTGNTIPADSNFSNSSIHAIDGRTAWVSMSDFSGATSGGIFKTTDGGATWVQQTTAFSNPGGFANFVSFFDADDGVCMGDPTGGFFEIYTTSDGGDNWIRVPQTNIPDPLTDEFGFPSVFFLSSDSTIWFGTNRGRIFRSTDRGTNWDAFDVGLGTRSVQCAFQNTEIGLAVTVFGRNIARTTDGGITWTRLPTPPPIAGAINYIPGTESSYMICSVGAPLGTPLGSAYTLDGGASWTVIDNVDHNAAFFVNPSVGWTGSFSDVIYKWSGPTLPVEEFLPEHLPQKISLSQNYPNPFNPETEIRFALPEASHVVLKIFNVRGQEIRTLVDADYGAGYHSARWDGKNESGKAAASGVYVYQFRAGSFSHVKKMLLVR